MPDSGMIITVLNRPVYSTSATDTNDGAIWIQAPLSTQQYETSEPLLINGIYARSKKIDPLGDAEILREFAAWEAASDEALLNFEKGLD